MNRKGLEQLIFDTYSVEPDYPWMDTPESAVFRHAANRKWFALVTTVPKSKLGLPGQQPVDIVNLKCDPILIGSLRAEPGFYPAYHMNKENWITAALDGSAPEDKLRLVLGMILFTVVSNLRTWSKNNASPRLTVPATVVAKRMNVSRHHTANAGDMTGAHGYTSTSATTYYVTFQVESGDRMELRLSGTEYGQLAEGDTGKLSFQGTRYLGFERKDG